MPSAGGPLAGRTIVITRNKVQATALQAELAARGAVPLLCPVVAYGPPESWTAVDAALARWDRIEWVVFPSANAVIYLLERMAARNLGGDAWRGKRVAAVGEATAAELAARGIAVEAVPSRHTAGELARLLLVRCPRPAGEALIPRSSRAREELAERLAAGGWPVRAVTAYTNTPADPGPDVRGRLESVDAVLFAAPSAVEGFAAVAGSRLLSPPSPDPGRGHRARHRRGAGELAPAALVVAEPTRRRACCDPWKISLHRIAVEPASSRALHWRQRSMSYDFFRFRRLRRTDTLRRMVRETVVLKEDLIYPLFAVPGRGVKEITSMPGVFQMSVDVLAEECRAVSDLGIPAVILFGIPETKDETGSSSWAADGIISRAVAAVKAQAPDLAVITDVCFCEYTSHGHCGVIRDGDVATRPPSRTWPCRRWPTPGRAPTWWPRPT